MSGGTVSEVVRSAGIPICSACDRHVRRVKLQALIPFGLGVALHLLLVFVSNDHTRRGNTTCALLMISAIVWMFGFLWLLQGVNLWDPARFKGRRLHFKNETYRQQVDALNPEIYARR